MTTLSPRKYSRKTIGSLCISLFAISISNSGAVAADDEASWQSNPLVKLVRDSTRQFRDPQVAIDMGYVPDPFCVSGRDEGGMGIHFVNGSLIGDGMVDATMPEVLVYEPRPNGSLRLVAAEYITFAEPPVALEGHLLNRSSTPNRYGIPAPYLEIHVWAWKRNPKGTFADNNPNVSCDAQPLDS